MRVPTIILLTIALMLSACQSAPEYDFNPEQIEQAIQNYMNCDECSNHQLHHVVILGERAKDRLEELLDPPDVTISSEYNIALAARFEALVVKYSLPIDAEVYVDTHVAARNNRTRTRAAIALNLINDRLVPKGEVFRLREGR